MKTDASQGIVLNIIVGPVGASVGGRLFGFLGGAGAIRLNLYRLGGVGSRRHRINLVGTDG